jgi:DNA invertase Pin-like site-specific DNA recombinase
LQKAKILEQNPTERLLSFFFVSPSIRRFVAYYRVSTARQGRSGLGLEAQKAAVLAFINANAELVAEFTEVESGKQGGLQPTSAPSSRRSCEAA